MVLQTERGVSLQSCQIFIRTGRGVIRQLFINPIVHKSSLDLYFSSKKCPRQDMWYSLSRIRPFKTGPDSDFFLIWKCYNKFHLNWMVFCPQFPHSNFVKFLSKLGVFYPTVYQSRRGSFTLCCGVLTNSPPRCVVGFSRTVTFPHNIF